MVAAFFAFIFGFPFNRLLDEYILADCVVLLVAESQIHIYDTNVSPRPSIRDDGETDSSEVTDMSAEALFFHL